MPLSEICPIPHILQPCPVHHRWFHQAPIKRVSFSLLSNIASFRTLDNVPPPESVDLQVTSGNPISRRCGQKPLPQVVYPTENNYYPSHVFVCMLKAPMNSLSPLLIELPAPD